MALHGKGEPRPTTLQVATQAATIELFRQWQTYSNGVHMDWDTFRSIDFRSLASAVLNTAEFTTLLDEHMPAPNTEPTLPRPLAHTESAARVQEIIDELDGKNQRSDTLAKVEQRVQDEATREHEARRAYGLSAADVAAHEGQVQG